MPHNYSSAKEALHALSEELLMADNEDFEEDIISQKINQQSIFNIYEEIWNNIPEEDKIRYIDEINKIPFNSIEGI